MTSFHPLDVVDVRHETRDSVVVTLRPPSASRAAFRHTQGQYLTLRREFDGEELRRSYSICAPVGACDLRVGIKKVDGGRFSTWANEGLRVGERIEAMAPAGNFHIPLEPEAQHRYLAVAVGSGITPVISIVETTLTHEPGSSFTLVYGNRASGTIMFREALEDLKNRFLGRLNLVHVLTREHQDVELFNGRIDRAKCDALFARWVNVAAMDGAFVCGPASMMRTVREALIAHGLGSEKIKTELFEAPDAPPPRRRAPAAAEAVEEALEVDITLHGLRTVLGARKGEESVLEAGERAGLELPYSCRSGICSTCRARLLEGEVEMDVNYALEDYEIQRGFILTCQSYPVTDKVVIDYDQ